MRRLKLSLLIGSTTLLMIGFQNCAKYQYSQVDKLADGSNAGLNTDDIPDGSILPIDQTSTNNEQPGSSDPGMSGTEAPPPPVADNNGGGSDNPPPPPVASNNGGGSDDNSSDDDSEDNDRPLPIASNNGGGSDNPPPPPVADNNGGGSDNPPPPPVASNNGGGSDDNSSDDDSEDNDRPLPVAGNNSDDNSSDDDSEDDGKPNPRPVADNNSGDEVDDVTGCDLEKLRGSANNRDGIANARNGKIYVTEFNIGALTSIDDFHGKIVLCGVNLDSVSRTGGNLTLVDSNVKEISDHNGGIKVLGNSSCTNISNSKGVLEVDRKATEKSPVSASHEGKGKGKG